MAQKKIAVCRHAINKASGHLITSPDLRGPQGPIDAIICDDCFKEPPGFWANKLSPTTLLGVGKMSAKTREWLDAVELAESTVEDLKLMWINRVLEKQGKPLLTRQQALDAPSPPKIRRNDLCPCGSKKKYKKCCSRALQAWQNIRTSHIKQVSEDVSKTTDGGYSPTIGDAYAICPHMKPILKDLLPATLFFGGMDYVIAKIDDGYHIVQWAFLCDDCEESRSPTQVIHGRNTFIWTEDIARRWLGTNVAGKDLQISHYAIEKHNNEFFIFLAQVARELLENLPNQEDTILLPNDKISSVSIKNLADILLYIINYYHKDIRDHIFDKGDYSQEFFYASKIGRQYLQDLLEQDNWAYKISLCLQTIKDTYQRMLRDNPEYAEAMINITYAEIADDIFHNLIKKYTATITADEIIEETPGLLVEIMDDSFDSWKREQENQAASLREQQEQEERHQEHYAEQNRRFKEKMEKEALRKESMLEEKRQRKAEQARRAVAYQKRANAEYAAFLKESKEQRAASHGLQKRQKLSKKQKKQRDRQKREQGSAEIKRRISENLAMDAADISDDLLKAMMGSGAIYHKSQILFPNITLLEHWTKFLTETEEETHLEPERRLIFIAGGQERNTPTWITDNFEVTHLDYAPSRLPKPSAFSEPDLVICRISKAKHKLFDLARDVAKYYEIPIIAVHGGFSEIWQEAGKQGIDWFVAAKPRRNPYHPRSYNPASFLFKSRDPDDFSFQEWPDGSISIYDPDEQVIMELDGEEAVEFDEDLEMLDEQWADGGPVGVFETYGEHLDEFLSSYEN